MKKLLVALALAPALSGCAGLTTAWRIQLDMIYQTPADKPAPTLPAGKAS